MYVKKWKYLVFAAALFAAFTLIPFSASAAQQTGSAVPAITTATAGVHSTITPVRWWGYRHHWRPFYGFSYGVPYGYYAGPYPYPYYYYGYPGYYGPGLSFNFGF